MIMTLVVASGCASKKYVGKEVGAVNQKVESLSESVEKNQERIGRNESEIKKVDAKATEAGELAGSAKDDAAKAYGEAQRALKGKLLYEVTLSNDKVAFDFNAAKLSADAETIVAELAEKIKADNRSLYIEIEGHTDSTGPDEYNEQLGMQRAVAVRDYLYQTQGIPLHVISAFSYGEAQPIADNGSRDGRARNRRVVIKVLE
jgi:outer membrane protein OmpA-like peptidoglycan-associated protein